MRELVERDRLCMTLQGFDEGFGFDNKYNEKPSKDFKQVNDLLYFKRINLTLKCVQSRSQRPVKNVLQ